MENLQRNINQVGSDFRAIKEKIEAHGVSMSDAQKTADYAQKIDDVYDIGYNRGEEDGYNAGYNIGDKYGYDRGYDDGYNNGYDEGYNNGYDEGAAESWNGGYHSGYADGYDAGYEEGYEEGKQAEYDAFWDAYQDNGNRTNYNGAFMGYGWIEETMLPKYPIHTSQGYMMFAYCGFEGDLDDVFINKGVPFTLDAVASGALLSYFFYNSRIKKVGTIDLTGYRGEMASFFNTPTLEMVRAFYPPISTMNAACFASSGNSLKEFIVCGEITNTFNTQRCTILNKISITSIIDHLSVTTSGLTVTLSNTAVNKAFETSDGANNGSTSTEWLALVATKQNWTIALA